MLTLSISEACKDTHLNNPLCQLQFLFILMINILFGWFYIYIQSIYISYNK